MKLPTRGFSHARFAKRMDTINLEQIEASFQDGEVVNEESLRKHGYISGKSHGIKILGQGKLTKKVTIEAHGYSAGAKAKLEVAGIEYKAVEA